MSLEQILSQMYNNGMLALSLLAIAMAILVHSQAKYSTKNTSHKKKEK